jgi:Ca2+-transporting ATPase
LYFKVLLSIAAVVSLALGLFQDFGTPQPAGQPPVDWVEGVAIMIAVLIVVSQLCLLMSHSPHFSQVVVGSINDWQKERQFKVLNEKKEERGVKVIRNGVERLIDVKVSLCSFNLTPSHHFYLCAQEVVVDDVALLEPGEIVPYDSIFLAGHNVKCDESAATGELDAIKKASYADCLVLKQALSGVHTEGGVLGSEHVSTHTNWFQRQDHDGCYCIRFIIPRRDIHSPRTGIFFP